MNRIVIIAEAGVNHNGDIACAKKMIEVAAEAGADVVKFQTFNSVKLATRFAVKAEYQKRTRNAKESQLSMLKQLELKKHDHRILQRHCKKNHVRFLSTAFDLESLRFLYSLKLPFFKVPSGEITNYPYLRQIAGYNKPVVVSTGMSTVAEVDNAIQVLLQFGLSRTMITLLHCNTEYPTAYDDVNLMAMLSMKTIFGVKIGYSDHTPGIEVPIAAAALGATVIEKHFTLDRNMKGPDHKASLEPHELRAMVTAIRNIEMSLGDGIKHPTRSELKNKLIARKSIVAGMKINKGQIFTEKNLTTKRPGNGISPMEWNNVIGKRASRDFNEDELIIL